MPIYKVFLKNKENSFVKNIIANNTLEAMSIAQKIYNAYPVKVSAVFYLHKIYKINAKYELSILKELHILLSCGLDLYSAMDEIINNTKDKFLKSLLEDISLKVQYGQSLSKSLPNTYKNRRAIVVRLLEVAEKSGAMVSVLDDIIQYLEETKNGLQDIKKALAYPIFLSIFSIMAMFFISIYVFPQIENIFSSFHQEMPIYTRIILDMGKYMQIYYFHILSFLFLSSIILYIYYKNSKKFKYWTHKYIFTIPILGNLLYIHSIYLFIFNFRILLHSQVPLLESLKIASKTISNLHIKNKVLKSIELIKSGKTLATSLRETKLLKTTFIRLLLVGEKSDSLDPLLLSMTKALKKDYKQQLSYVHTVLEPLILIVIALFILLLALSTFVPIWSLSANL